MKSKLPNCNIERCGECLKEMTINECAIHKVEEACYFCHLKHEHMTDFDDEVDEKELPLNPTEGGNV